MTCTLTVLGCSGGIGGPRRTTALLLNEDTLIDCGTGVGDLSLDQLKKIDRVFLTHSHLDHLACLPLLLDSVGSERDKPLIVFGLSETLGHLKQHIFNNVIWPDFTRIPTPDTPWVTLHPIGIGHPHPVDQHVNITALPAYHSVTGVGYAINSSTSTLVFTGDSGPCPEFWTALATLPNVNNLLIECSFVNSEAALAVISGHYHPTTLVNALNAHLPTQSQVWVSHLKPGAETTILEEISNNCTANTAPLTPGQIIRF
jgi:ribonuclease BN (tRNA processing enzyme)